MKWFSFTFVLALALPSAAFAQATPPAMQSPAAAAAPANLMMDPATLHGAFHMLSHVQATQRAARIAMLTALTPAHRQLVSSLVGGLAVAPNPDIDAAAKQLDVALSRNEIAAIGNAQGSSRAQMMGAAGAMANTLSPEQRRKMAQQAAQAMRAMSSTSMGPAVAKAMQDQNDPGHVLLITVLSGLQPYNRIFQGFSRSAP